MSSVVLAVGPGHTLRETATKMTEKGTGAALVFDDESPAPRIITERDILNAVGTGKDPDDEKVADHMSESVISAEPSWSLEQAAEEMVQRGIRHLVIVDRGEVGGASPPGSWGWGGGGSACSRRATSCVAGRRSARPRP